MEYKCGPLEQIAYKLQAIQSNAVIYDRQRTKATDIKKNNNIYKGTTQWSRSQNNGIIRNREKEGGYRETKHKLLW